MTPRIFGCFSSKIWDSRHVQLSFFQVKNNEIRRPEGKKRKTKLEKLEPISTNGVFYGRRVAARRSGKPCTSAAANHGLLLWRFDFFRVENFEIIENLKFLKKLKIEKRLVLRWASSVFARGSCATRPEGWMC